MGFPFIPEVRRRSQRRVVIAVAVLSLTCACRSTPTLAKLERGGSGPATMVLLHGYGSSAEEWLPFVATIRLPDGGRFLFPQAPETTTPPDGPSTGRAWWRLDLGSHPSSSPGGGPDLSSTRPPGLKVAAAMVEELVKNVERAGGKPILLGGFSQGAMVAAEVALQSDVHVDALGTCSPAHWLTKHPGSNGLRRCATCLSSCHTARLIPCCRLLSPIDSERGYRRLV